MIITIGIVVSMQSIFGPIKTLEKSNETNDHVLGLSFKTDNKIWNTCTGERSEESQIQESVK